MSRRKPPTRSEGNPFVFQLLLSTAITNPMRQPLVPPTGGVDRRLVAPPRLPHRQPLLGMIMTSHISVLVYSMASALNFRLIYQSLFPVWSVEGAPKNKKLDVRPCHEPYGSTNGSVLFLPFYPTIVSLMHLSMQCLFLSSLPAEVVWILHLQVLWIRLRNEETQ
jgi:hypothetical protein